jgi:hypothetical protein
MRSAVGVPSTGVGTQRALARPAAGICPRALPVARTVDIPGGFSCEFSSPARPAGSSAVRRRLRDARARTWACGDRTGRAWFRPGLDRSGRRSADSAGHSRDHAFPRFPRRPLVGGATSSDGAR